MNAPGLSVGDVIAQKYRVEQILGAGGMGVVVAARHLQLDQEVAIKFLARDMLGDATAVSRFDREARAAAKLKGEHAVRVFDVGTLPDGAPYLVMERLHGSDLSAWLQRSGALPLEDAADFVVQACVALGEAHRAGIIHRDIKPSNLFCVGEHAPSVSIKVLDFGISKLTLATPLDGSITATATAIGSPNYMSPEQMRSANRVDSRTDIWSLGVVLYELVTGRLPFYAETYPELCLKIAGDPPEPPSVHRAGLPEGFQRIVLRCLEKNPDLRFASVDALAEALLEFAPARTRFRFERLAGLGATPDTLGSTSSLSGGARPARSPRFAWGRTARGWPALVKQGSAESGSKRALWLFGAAGLLACGGLLAAGFWWRESGSEAVQHSDAAALPVPEPALHAAVPAVPPLAPLDSAPSPVVVPVEPALSPSPSASARVTTGPVVAPKPAASARAAAKVDRRSKTSVWTRRD